jgi:hypothetical protein
VRGHRPQLAVKVRLLAQGGQGSDRGIIINIIIIDINIITNTGRSTRQLKKRGQVKPWGAYRADKLQFGGLHEVGRREQLGLVGGHDQLAAAHAH